MDVGGKAVATLSGTINMMGNVGGFVSPIVCGHIVKHTGNWSLAFYVNACAYLLGALWWLAMDPVTHPSKNKAERPDLRTFREGTEGTCPNLLYGAQ